MLQIKNLSVSYGAIEAVKNISLTVNDGEIVSLIGTVNTMNGEYYSHLHMSAANESGAVVGGHLNAARVSATCEMVIRVIDGAVDRFKDDVTGLNLFKF